MIVIAHAGHWAVQLIYMLPLVVLVGVLVRDRLRHRGEEEPQNDHPANEEPT